MGRGELHTLQGQRLHSTILLLFGVKFSPLILSPLLRFLRCLACKLCHVKCLLFLVRRQAVLLHKVFWMHVARPPIHLGKNNFVVCGGNGKCHSGIKTRLLFVASEMFNAGSIT